MEMKSPPPCPPTVTVRRNPPRKARATPSSAIPLSKPLSSPSLSRNIFSTETVQNPNKTDDSSNTDSSVRILSENLKVFLRIRPLSVQKSSRTLAELKNVWPKNPKIKGNSRPKIKKSCELCVQVNEDVRSVTVSTPQQLQEMKRIKSEIYEGFSHVFASGASQTDVYEEMVKPLIEDFLKGKSGMLAAMGPSGSGKTHTVFGCAREPGMVPLAIRRIFSENESAGAHTSRVFYLSMFEISSEKGKAERMIDLLHDGGEISMQQSVIKGLQEAVVSDAQQAECLIAHGMLRRATAITNSNTQSSRSQCIINIRRDSTQGAELDGNTSSTMFTIVDLAGAEREKKTGNQGARLLESNFINNTSMVFGQCLRSLLEHQRNRNKPLQKHYKNSLLTRYLQDYLAGKKRMALILTVKPGVEDYLDTSFLLRQTSPFTRIKFKTVEEPVNFACNKRPNQALPQAGQLKKMKLNSEVSLIEETNIDSGLGLNMPKEIIARKVIKGCLNQNIEEAHDEKSPLNGDYGKPTIEKDREFQIMQGLSKAMWTFLKQYKERLKGLEMENRCLRDNLDNEKTRGLDLENELTREKMSLFNLENELKVLKSQCTCGKASSDVFPISMHDAPSNISEHQMADSLEVNSEILSCSSSELKKPENWKKTDPSARDSSLTSASCSAGPEDHCTQSSDGAENTKGLKDISDVDICSTNSQVLSTSTINSEVLIFHENTGLEDTSSRNQATSQSRSGSLDTSFKSEQDTVKIVGDVKNLEQESEYISNEPCFATNRSEVLICHENTGLEDWPSGSQATSQLTSGSFDKSCMSEHDTVDIVGDAKGLEQQSEYILSGPSFATSSSQVLICHENKSPEDMPSGSQATRQSISGSLDISCKSEQDTLNIVGDVKSLEQESQYVSNGPCFATSLECESAERTQDYEDSKDATQELSTQFEDMPSRSEATSRSTSESFVNHKSKQDAIEIVGGVEDLEPESEDAKNGSSFDTSLECEDSAESTQDSEDLKDAKQDQTQFENGATDNGLPLIEVRIVPVTAHSDTALKYFESRLKEGTCYHVDEEQCNNEEGKGQQEPLVVTGLPEEGSDATIVPKFVPVVALRSNIQLPVKPKRRLQPASSVLLKDISLLSIKDENDKPKGGRVGKRGTTEGKKRSQGSLSLLNLLTK